MGPTLPTWSTRSCFLRVLSGSITPQQIEETAQAPSQLKRLPGRLDSFMNQERRVSEGKRRSCRLLGTLRKIIQTHKGYRYKESLSLNHRLHLNSNLTLVTLTKQLSKISCSSKQCWPGIKISSSSSKWTLKSWVFCWNQKSWSSRETLMMSFRNPPRR